MLVCAYNTQGDTIKIHRLAPAVAFSGLLAFTLVAAPPIVAAPRCKEPATITIPLQGSIHFNVYAIKEHRVVFDEVNTYTLCAAELIISNKQNGMEHTKDVVLHTRESFDNGDGTQTMFREIYFKGTMTPSGQLKISWPKTWNEMNWATGKVEPVPYPNVIAQMEDHTGYDLFGPAIDGNTVDLFGSFDGKELFAGLHVYAFQEKPGSMGPPYDVVADGPVEWSMWIELKVAQ